MWVAILRMPRRFHWAVILSVLFASSAQGQEPDLVFTGEVPTGPETHFFVSFEVPEGIVEVEIRHDNLTPGNVLDWGLDDPNGFRGWGGGNSEPAILGMEAATRSYVPGPMPAGTWEVVVGKARIDELPALYRIEIFLRTVATLPPQPRTPYQDPGVLSDEARWYAGDLHVHSRQSGDARASLEECLDYARDVAGLDFVMFSEHNTNSGLTYYGTIQPDYPDVLIIPGVEWTTYSGHANAIGATEWVDHKTGVRGATVEGAIEAYQDQDALFYPTHPLEDVGRLCLGCLWEYEVDPKIFDGVEVSSGIWDGTDFWEMATGDGSHAVALGGSDDHDAGEGNMVTGRPIGTPTVMVYAEGLSVDAIMTGIRAGRTVVRFKNPDFDDDPMIETELSGERVGDTVFADTATLSAIVTGGEGNELLVIKNGSMLEAVDITSDPFIHELEITAPDEGEDRYRHQVNVQRFNPNTKLTVGSYVWLRAAEESPDGGTPDGGAPDGGTDPSSSSGCDCRVVAPSDYDMALCLFFAGALAYLWRSRRRST